MDHKSSLQKACLLLDAGRHEQITALLLPVCTSSDRSMQEAAYILLIKASLLADDSFRGIEFARKALETGLDSASLRLACAWAFSNAELYQQALKHLLEALKQEPEDSAIHTELARVHFNMGLYHMAERYGRQALELSPNDTESMAVLGWTLCYLEKDKEAIALIDKALSIDPADEMILRMRAILEKDSGKSLEIFRRVLSANPQHRQAARQYRQLIRHRPNLRDGLLFGAYVLLSLSLLLLDIPRLQMWPLLYLPGAWILGRNWRLGLPFFLLSFGLLSQHKDTFEHWTLVGVVVMSLVYTMLFWFLNIVAGFFGTQIRNRFTSLKLHVQQGTLAIKFREKIEEMANVDSLVILLGSGLIYAASLKLLPGWSAWCGFLPLLLLIKYKGSMAIRFLLAAAPIFYGDLAILQVAIFAPPVFSVVLVVMLMLLQLYLVHRMYLRKVRYAYVR
jgi:tetratricopeptide (TPR) repeat protein